MPWSDSGGSYFDSLYNAGRRQTPLEQLTTQVSNLVTTLGGGDGQVAQDALKNAGLTSKDPLVLGQAFISDLLGKREQYRKDLPDIFRYYREGVERGRLTTSEAEQSVLSTYLAAGAKPRTAYKRAGQISRMEQGVPSQKSYERYVPFMQLSAEQLLGRNLKPREVKNYVSAARGLGITNPNDFAAAFGEMMLSSPEGISRQYRYRPTDVSVDKSASQAFQNMLNA